MYGMPYNNTSGVMLKTGTVENSTKFHKSTVTYMATLMVLRSKEAYEIPKSQYLQR